MLQAAWPDAYEPGNTQLKEVLAEGVIDGSWDVPGKGKYHNPFRYMSWSVTRTYESGSDRSISETPIGVNEGEEISRAHQNACSEGSEQFSGPITENGQATEIASNP